MYNFGWSKMRKQNENYKQKILYYAKKEFLASGFEKASMRKIAKEAKMTPSNIYNYFSSKDEIFETLLKPILDGIRLGIRLVSDKDYFEKRLQLSHETLKEKFHVVLNYVDQNRELFKMLFFLSSGSKYQNYHEKLLQELTDLNIKQLDYYKKSKNMHHLYVNKFLVRTLVSFFLNIFIEMIRCNIPRSEVEEVESQLIQFMDSGSKAILMDIKE